MFLEIVIAVCVLVILYQQYVINNIRKERIPSMTFTPLYLKGGRMDILWRDSNGKPYDTAMGMPEGIRADNMKFDENTFQVTFSSV